MSIDAGNNPVENFSIGTDQQLEISKTELPDQFDDIMTMVTNEFGLPVSYMKVHTANLMSMVIPPRSKRGNILVVVLNCLLFNVQLLLFT